MAAVALTALAVPALAWALVNGAILGASLVARATVAGERPAPADGVGHLRRVDDNLWRGAAPTAEGYRQLAARGVRTVVDLRAESPLRATRATRVTDPATAAGLEVVHLPLEDGHAPTTAQVQRFLDTVRAAAGPVFVHCNAGVGRTGSMSAAYLVTTGQATPEAALRRSLAVGPPSLEQVAFMRTLTTGGPTPRHPAVDAVSRVADAPRKLWGKLF